MAKDSDYRRMIHSKRWVNLRRMVLTVHPLCEKCEADGLVTLASEVHHRIPVESATNPREKERLMFSKGNLEALCHVCHVERHIALGRSGKAATRRLTASQVDNFNRDFFGE